MIWTSHTFFSFLFSNLLIHVHVPISSSSCLISCYVLEKQFLRKCNGELYIGAVKVSYVWKTNWLHSYGCRHMHLILLTFSYILYWLLNNKSWKCYVFTLLWDKNLLLHLLFILLSWTSKIGVKTFISLNGIYETFPLWWSLHPICPGAISLFLWN